LVFGSPWAFGCADPVGEFVLVTGIAALVLLWAAHAVVSRRILYTSDPVSICLLGLVLLTALQLVPLPESVVRFVSPTRAAWHRTLTPELPELLPGEADSATLARPTRLPLTLSPAATEDLLVELLAVFLAYAAARNFVVPGHEAGAFRRLAWAGFVTGAALALLGLAQHLSGTRTLIYWRVDGGGPVFGPFANKNHFAFQVHLFGGLAAGLFLCVARRGNWRVPVGLALLGGLGLMAAGVAFSQSRGGMLAGFVAACLTVAVACSVRRERQFGSLGSPGWVLVIGVVVVAVALISWFGWSAVADRLLTLGNGATDGRETSWRAAFPLVGKFPAVGVGGGGIARAEPLVRTRTDFALEFNTLDNEYLEALVEGGIVRCALTLSLAFFAVWAAVAAYRRDPRKPDAPLLLGCVFGLSAVAIQSAVDFGIHIPSISLAAAVVAAYSGSRGQAVNKPNSSVVLTGVSAYFAAALLLLAALLIGLGEWRNYRVYRLRVAASTAFLTADPIRRSKAIAYLETAVRVRPNAAAVWDDLSASHLLIAAERQQLAVAGVAGPLAFAVPPDVPPTSDPDGHIASALRAARASRNAQPLGLEAHLTLGRFAHDFARSEPSAAHFDRAKFIANFDSGPWYVAGRTALDRNDLPTAAVEFRASLARSPKYLEAIIRAARTRFTPDELRTQLLPDDPALWSAAVPFVFPIPNDPARVVWLKATADRWATGAEPGTLAAFTDWATVLEQLGDGLAAVKVWRRAVERFPSEATVRDRFAACLEGEELYEEAQSVLESLVAQHPERRDLRHRLEAVRHALKLKADIDR